MGNSKFNKRTKEVFTYTTRSKTALAKILRSEQEYGGGKKINRRKTYKRRKTKHKKTKQTVSVYLEKGSLLVMKGTTQINWLHRLPPTKKVKKPRINLTFRIIEPS